ncbi:MAG: hypothetical protein IJX35_02965 [Candidatus Methanomethylophilaceae archaeon]|nr:hypothetical protein [Candidatus Methanomethylophilaceae archaeon]
MTPEREIRGGGAWHRYALLTIICILLVSSAYAVYDLNGGSLDIRDSEVRLVVTGSMDGEPTDYPISTIPVNSLVVIRHIDPDSFDFEVGQVIAYDSDGMVIVHRVIDIDEGKRELRLKGDANKTFEIVSYDDVIGEVVGVSPFLGKVMLYMRSNVVLVIAFIACSSLIVYSVREIVRYLREE